MAFGCNVLQTGGGQEEFNVTTTGGATYSGPVNVSFYDYPGSGHIFPPTSVQGATPVGSWQPVPAADIGASAVGLRRQCRLTPVTHARLCRTDSGSHPRTRLRMPGPWQGKRRPSQPKH